MRHQASAPTRRRTFAAALALAAVTGVLLAAQTPRRLGVDLTAFDRSVRPQDDFYNFVNGSWMKTVQIPPDKSTWGSFATLADESDTALKGILDDVTKTPQKPGSTEQQVADLYLSFMDTARIETLGTEPLGNELKQIAALSAPADLAGLLGRLARPGVRGPFAAFVGPDQKKSTENIVSITQAGLGMPDRDYYLRDDAKSVQTREAYQKYVTTMLTLAKQPDPAGAAGRIVALETSIAKLHWDRAKNRDRDATYNKMTVAQLAASMPAFNWPTYLRAAGMEKATEVIVRQPDYFTALNDLIRTTPLSTWKEALTFELISTYSDELPDAFGQAQFEFRGRVLQGLQERRARDKRGIDEVENLMGEPLGKLYVARYFKPEAKARMDQLVKNLLAAFKVGIDELDWMSPATKKEAQAKLAKFTVKIAYPDEWRDYSSIAVKRDDLMGNVKRAAGFQYDDMVSRLGKPVDKTRWGMTPQTVNAYYNFVNNEIVFPAAILQPPFFDAEADDAVNYGAIGAVIGHEISHGFDDQGSKSDGDGNMRNWFTPEDLKAFQARGAKLAAQYEAHKPIDDIPINGKLTLGENIGDLSGLEVAFRAYRMSLGGSTPPVVEGFTGDQRFFLGYAQVWRTAMRPETLRQRLVVDPHSPGMYRALVPLTNMQAFYDAWDVKPGDRMYRAPEDRVKIW